MPQYLVFFTHFDISLLAKPERDGNFLFSICLWISFPKNLVCGNLDAKNFSTKVLLNWPLAGYKEETKEGLKGKFGDVATFNFSFRNWLRQLPASSFNLGLIQWKKWQADLKTQVLELSLEQKLQGNRNTGRVKLNCEYLVYVSKLHPDNYSRIMNVECQVAKCFAEYSIK